MQARQKMLRNIFVPKRFHLLRALPLLHPLGNESFVDKVDDLDEEGASTSGRVEDLHEILVR